MLNETEQNTENNQFNISLNNYEGPIDLLLELAKKQKVDLSEISVLELAEQYLVFIDKFKELHLEIAADYLVMAAWLTYLKSRILLPKDEKEDVHTPEELEEAIKYQLKRLEAMQKVSKILYSLPIIGRDTFYGGTIEGIKIIYNLSYNSTFYDLIKNYTNILKRTESSDPLTIDSSALHSVDQAITRLKDIFGSITEWTNFLYIIPNFLKNSKNLIVNKSLISSNFVASLELVKNGYISVKQDETFGNIFVKSNK